MTVKELKDKLDKLPNDTEVLVSSHGSNCGFSITFSYDSPDFSTFMYGDNKLLICGYDDDSYDGRNQVVKVDYPIFGRFVRI